VRLVAAALTALVCVCPALASRGESLAPVRNFVEPSHAWAQPLRGPLESPFGWRWGRLHAGIDISAHLHTDVHAAYAGVVKRVGWLRGFEGYGLVVTIRHGGGVQTLYAHLASVRVRPGDLVAAGDRIGRAGCTGSCTGAHLHFEVRLDGGPVNPLRYLVTSPERRGRS
jgi:murein DD-endopeptidase MepM/ murein hydrolase activator NlpD